MLLLLLLLLLGCCIVAVLAVVVAVVIVVADVIVAVVVVVIVIVLFFNAVIIVEVSGYDIRVVTNNIQHKKLTLKCGRSPLHHVMLFFCVVAGYIDRNLNNICDK
jgi:hypothetical protein